jgi:hypothetical protein
MKAIKTITIITATSLIALAPVALRAGEEPAADRAEKRAKAFDAMDKNADGNLSKDEFMATKKNQEDPERAGKVFAKLDKDANGILSKEEFVSGPDKGKKKAGASDGGAGE